MVCIDRIDRKLEAAGWQVQDKKRLNLYAGLGVAVREMDTDTGPVDYMLFVDGKACGISEAKREGTDLGGVAEQSGRYATSHTQYIQRWELSYAVAQPVQSAVLISLSRVQ